MTCNRDFVRGLFAKVEGNEPLSLEELAAYNTSRAAEMARAEARRNPPAEPELPLGAPDNGC